MLRSCEPSGGRGERFVTLIKRGALIQNYHVLGDLPLIRSTPALSFFRVGNKRKIGGITATQAFL